MFSANSLLDFHTRQQLPTLDVRHVGLHHHRCRCNADFLRSRGDRWHD